MLVATDPEIEKRAAEDQKLAGSAAVPGIVVLGDQTRFVIEAGDEALNVFNILQIVNTARTPVQTAAPVVFDLPAGASGAGVLDGSAPNAVATPGRVTVTGPFRARQHMVQFALFARVRKGHADDPTEAAAATGAIQPDRAEDRFAPVDIVTAREAAGDVG